MFITAGLPPSDDFGLGFGYARPGQALDEGVGVEDRLGWGVASWSNAALGNPCLPAQAGLEQAAEESPRAVIPAQAGIQWCIQAIPA